MASLLDILSRFQALGRGPNILPVPSGPLPGQSFRSFLREVERIERRNRRAEEKAEQNRQSLLRLGGQQAMGGVGGFFGPGIPTLTQAGSAISQAAGGIGTVTGALIGGPMGAAVGGVVQILGVFGDKLFSTVDKLNRWGESLLKTNLQFAEFSGAMSQVQAQREMADVRFGQRMGNRLAPTASRLNQAMIDLRSESFEQQSGFLELLSTFATNWMEGVRWIPYLLNHPDRISELWNPPPEEQKKTGAGDLMEEWLLRQPIDNQVQQMGRPQRFQQP